MISYHIATEKEGSKIWGAIITGLHPIYKLNRLFSFYQFLSSVSYKYAYFSYYIDIENNQFFETSIVTKYKNKRQLYLNNDGFVETVSIEDVIKYYEKLS